MTLVERDIMGGAANLWDCIPSKAMIATGGVIGVTGRGRALGLTCTGATLDLPALAERIGMISGYLERSVTDLLTSQEVRVVRGRGTFKGPRQVVVETSEGRVLELLRSDEPIHIETLITSAEISPSRAAAALVGLELGGWARQLEGQRWLTAAVHGEGRTPSGDQ